MPSRGEIIRGAGGYLSRNNQLGVGIGFPTGGEEGDIRVQMVDGSPRLYARAGGQWYGVGLEEGVASEFTVGSTKDHVKITPSAGITIINDFQNVAALGKTLRVGAAANSTARVEINSGKFSIISRNASGVDSEVYAVNADGSIAETMGVITATEATIAHGDYMVFLDATDSSNTKKEALHDIANLFSGTGLTASSSVIGVDASQTQITSVGTIGTGTWEGTTIAVNQGGTGVTNSNSWLNSRITTNADGSLNYDATGATAVNHDNLTGFASNEHYTQANIVATGTIASGTWEGTTIAVDQGGTGATSLNNLITLTTHTTGNYVKKVTTGTGLDGAVDSEGATAALTLDLNELGTETTIAQDDFVIMVDATDNGSQKITFSNFEDQVFGNVSGDATVAAGGALTIAATSVEGSMLNDNIISGQDALGSASMAQADLLLIDDGPGTVKKVTFSDFEDSLFNNVSGDILIAAGGAATIQANSVALSTDTTGNYMVDLSAGTLIDVTHTPAEGSTGTINVDLSESSAAVMVGADEFIFLDSGSSNAASKETLSDLLDTIAGTVATTGLDRSGDTLVLSDLHPVGVSGSNNQLLTDDGDGTVTSESGLTFSGTALTLVDDGTMQSSSFASGFTGHGWRILDSSGTAQGAAASGNASATFDSLSVRGTMSVYEMLIQQVRATNGSLIVSSAAKVESVANYSSGTDEDGQITFESTVSGSLTCPFVANDIIMCQRVDVNAFVPGDATYNGTNIVVKKVLKVASVSANVVTTEDGGFVSGTAPAVGDEFVRIGNTTVAARQGILYLTSDDEDAPFIDVKSSVDSYADWDAATSTKVRVGKLKGITGVEEEYGLWAGVSGTQYLKATSVGLEVHATATLYTAYTGSEINFHDGTANPKMTIGAGNITMFADDSTTPVAVWNDNVMTLGSSTDKIVINGTSGMTIRENNVDGITLTNGVIVVGEVGAGKSNIEITSGAINLRNNTTDYLTLDTSGNITAKGIIKTTTAASDGNLGLLLDNDGSGYNQQVFRGANPEIWMGYTGSGGSMSGDDTTADSGDILGSSKIFMNCESIANMSMIVFATVETQNYALGGTESEFRIVTGGDIRTDANVAMSVGSNGNVGIGTVAPAKSLHVLDSALVKGRATFAIPITANGGTEGIDPTVSTTTTGVGTAFLTDLSIGDDLVVSGETRTVTAIASDTELTVNAAWSNNSNDATPDCNPAAFTVIRDTGAIGMVLDDDGNVGIGETSPDALLHLTSGTTNKPNLILENTSTAQNQGGTIYFRLADTDTNLGDNLDIGDILFQGWNITGSDWETAAMIRGKKDGATGGDSDMGGELSFWTTPDGSSTNAQRMVIDNAGNVGIGTDDPDTLLDIKKAATTGAVPLPMINLSVADGGVDLADGEGPAIDFHVSEEGATGGFSDHVSGRVAVVRVSDIDTYSGAAMTFWTGSDDTSATEKMRITHTGDVGIGTSPGWNLHVKDTNLPGSLALHRYDANVSDDDVIGEILFIGDEDHALNKVGRIRCMADGDWGTDDQPTYMIFETCPDSANLSTEKMRITQDGKVGIGTDAPTTTLQVNGSFTTGLLTYTSDTSVVARQAAGRPLLLGEVGGNALVTLTLPSATGTGDIYKFVVSVINTSGYLIVAANSSHGLYGQCMITDNDTDVPNVFHTNPDGSDDTIYLNGTTTGGGQIGDYIELIDIATNQWAVNGMVTCPAGSNDATMFSSTM